MKKAILLLMLCVGSLTTHAQHYFNQRNTLHSYFSSINSVIDRNGRYYCTADCVDSTNYAMPGSPYVINGIGFAVFDANGNRLSDTSIQLANRGITSVSNNLSMTTSNRFVIAGDDVDTGGHTRLLIVRFDTTGTPDFTREYNHPFCPGDSNNFLRLKDLKQTGTGEWLMLATIDCNGLEAPDVLLTKLDSNFNIIWQKKYGDPLKIEIAGKLLIEQDGYVIGCGENNSNVVFSNFTYQAKMIKVDTAGNELWTWKSDTAYKTNYIRDLIRTQDGGYAYCGSGIGIESGTLHVSINFKSWIEKIDANRNPVWHRASKDSFFNSQFNVIKETPLGNLQVFGNDRLVVKLDSLHYEDHYRGWFLTLNANGDSLKQRIYSGITTYSDRNYFYDAKPTSDGGYIMVGESTDQSPNRQAPVQRGWLVKVDSNGCVGPTDPRCLPLSVPRNPTAKNETRIYPNPVTAQLNINYQNNSTRGAVFALTDITGKTLAIQFLNGKSGIETVDMSRLASGIYLYRITEGGVVTKQGKIVRQ